MKFCLATNIVSPHQVPLARALVSRLGSANFRYVASEPVQPERQALGWGVEEMPSWVLSGTADNDVTQEMADWMSSADVLLCGNRYFDCFEKRTQAGRLTFYMSERWFKPPLGMWRLLHPGFLRMTFRLFRLLQHPRFCYLPMGVHAARDMQRMYKLLSCISHARLHHSPVTANTLRPKLLLWGYFVERSVNNGEHYAARQAPHETERAARSAHARANPETHDFLHILWVGRMLDWKRVDTLIQAVGRLSREGRPIHLSLVGRGPEEMKLRKLAASTDREIARIDEISTPHSPFPTPHVSVIRSSPISFHPPVPITQIRDWMRQADVYVLPSDGGEGWGAVVNEAMSEGCAVIATHECGAGATVINDGVNGLLFQAGNLAELTQCLCRLLDDPAFRMRLAKQGSETIAKIWSPDTAAQRLLALCDALLSDRAIPCFAEGPLAGVAE